MILGEDHQYGIPEALRREVGLSTNWREMLDALVYGSYGDNAPALGQADSFAKPFNEWLRQRGRPDYFYSATKGQSYGIPLRNPRGDADKSVYRVTELYSSIFKRGNPKAMNRLGDNGSVGGQTLVGLIKLRDLLVACAQEGIPLRCWPMDGLKIDGPEYEGAHVLVEPYPSASRELGIPQSDGADALAANSLISKADQEGRLKHLLDLSALSPEEATWVKCEGWIVGHTPLRRR